MRYDFSSAFLIIKPPATSFGEAWEHLCTDLLAAEHGTEAMIEPTSPDHGVDIYNQKTHHAYQCKSSEQGTAGTIPPMQSIGSLQTAVKHRQLFPWMVYSFCTNAPYSASGMAKIRTAGEGLGLDKEAIDFLGPQYWDEICSKYSDLVKDRFYYRVTANEKAVLDAFRNAGYYQQYVQEFAEKIRRQPFSLVITNNRTPVEIEIPFSPDLTVENYLDVAKQLLGVTLEWTNYPDMGTAAGTSLSVTIDQYPQTFSKKIGELPINAGDPLQLWIKILWQERPHDSAPTEEKAGVAFMSRANFLAFRDFEVPSLMKSLLSSRDRESVTTRRQEALIQSLMWDRLGSLRASTRIQRSPEGVSEFHTAGVYLRDLADIDGSDRRWLEGFIGQSLGVNDRLQIEVLRPTKHEDGEPVPEA
jgi:hypothetical protein